MLCTENLVRNNGLRILFTYAIAPKSTARRRLTNFNNVRQSRPYTSVIERGQEQPVRTIEEIGIPNAIERGTTDLLKALADTIGVDSTAPHFGLIDDPALIATDNNRDLYFSAKEMGRRAARQLAAEWPTLFMYDTDEPRIDAYRPVKVPDPTDLEANVENLSRLIGMKEVLAANQLYERMATHNTPIPQNILVELFRLLVYYNGRPKPAAEMEWHGWRNFGHRAEKEEQKTWDIGGSADILYEELEKNSEIYSLMIAGISKYQSAESAARAIEIFKEMKKNGHIATVEAYCGLVSIAKSWQEAVLYLKDMADNNVKPNTRIFNVLIEKAISTHIRDHFTLAINLLHEMLAVDCKPSLRTYSLIMRSALQTSTTKRTTALAHLVNILSVLECEKSIEMQEPGDEEFYISAMDLAYQSNNMSISERIIRLYESKNNNVRLPAFLGEAEFYGIYLQLVINQLDLNTVRAKYFSLVPRIVPLSTNLALTLFRRIQTENSLLWVLSRRLIEDCVSSRLILRPFVNKRLRSFLLEIDVEKMMPDEKEQLKELISKIIDIFLEISRFGEVENLKKMHKKLEPSFIAEMALVLIRLGDDKQGWNFFDRLTDVSAREGEEATVNSEGSPNTEIVESLLLEASKSKDWYNASKCLQVMVDYSLSCDLKRQTEQVIKNCKLSKIQTDILNSFSEAHS